MKTTLDLPDDVLREIKVRAAQENRRLKDVVAELLRQGLAADRGEAAGRPRRVRVPLVHCEPASPEQEMTPERAARSLLDDEARQHRRA